jgi:hypothetical protein
MTTEEREERWNQQCELDRIGRIRDEYDTAMRIKRRRRELAANVFGPWRSKPVPVAFSDEEHDVSVPELVLRDLDIEEILDLQAYKF